MATFPKLKTGAVMQYPATRNLSFSHDRVQFLDGSEQRYRDCSSVLRQWTIRLDQVEEGELAALEGFFLENQGAFASFAFVDPWSGVEYADCSLDSDRFEFRLEDGIRGRTSLVVRQNRG
ncbi:MAG TPA: DUF2460 domain-containing protein [Bryobacteraceae bacterium]|nr:DUF2460 domain-containing protein [Bryobacteraceae bacterium]